MTLLRTGAALGLALLPGACAATGPSSPASQPTPRPIGWATPEIRVLPSAFHTGLAMPEGLSQTPWGSFIVAETLARRLTEIDPANGTRRVVAENLPIGLEGGPGLPPPYMVTGVAVGDEAPSTSAPIATTRC